MINFFSFEIWCYECDNCINSKDSKLVQCIEFIKKELNRVSNATPTKNKDGLTNGALSVEGGSISIDSMRTSLTNTVSLISSLGGNIAIPGQAKRVLNNQSAIDQLPRVRGLSNLGNTCFFNAVTQCLAQTPFLLPILNELSKTGEEFELPGGKLKLKGAEVETELPKIFGQLSAWGPLTSALAETLEELQKSGGVFNPRKLFKNLTSKWPQFGGGDQHDSHELLRHLLEGVKTEDLQRYYKVILENLNYYKDYKGIDIKAAPAELQQKCKFYGQQVSDRILCPEQVFRGFLVSTLTCQDCFHTSSRHENFLDLSLPVCNDKPAPPIRRKSSPDDLSPANDSPRNKAKTEKARKMNNRSGSSSESDADVEDNEDEEIATTNEIDTNGNIEVKSEKIDDGPEFTDKDKNGKFFLRIILIIFHKFSLKFFFYLT